MFRAGKRGRWEHPDPSKRGAWLRRKADDAPEAWKDLEPRKTDAGRLSVYRIETEAEGEGIAVYHALNRPSPEKIYFVLMPDECLDGYEHVPAPDENIHSRIRDLHRLIEGMDDENRRLELARRVLSHEKMGTGRLSESAVVAKAKGLLPDPEVLELVSDRWRAVLAS